MWSGVQPTASAYIVTWILNRLCPQNGVNAMPKVHRLDWYPHLWGRWWSLGNHLELRATCVWVDNAGRTLILSTISFTSRSESRKPQMSLILEMSIYDLYDFYSPLQNLCWMYVRPGDRKLHSDSVYLVYNYTAIISGHVYHSAFSGSYFTAIDSKHHNSG